MAEEHKWELKHLAFEFEEKYECNNKAKISEKELEDYKKLV